MDLISYTKNMIIVDILNLFYTNLIIINTILSQGRYYDGYIILVMDN